MNRSFYNAAVGANAQMQRLSVQANNIANVNTFGYKAQRASFSDLLYRNLEGIEGAQVPRGTGAKVEMTSTDYSSGGVATSGNPLDYAIVGQGFFALQDPVDGTIYYSRDGSFAMTQAPVDPAEVQPGQAVVPKYYLSDGHGRRVLNQQGEQILITEQMASGFLPVGVFAFDHNDGMLHAGDNLFVPVEKNGQLTASNAQLVKGCVERSNVDLAQEISKVIESQRVYSLALKMVQTSDEIESTVNGLRG